MCIDLIACHQIRYVWRRTRDPETGAAQAARRQPRCGALADGIGLCSTAILLARNVGLGHSRRSNYRPATSPRFRGVESRCDAVALGSNTSVSAPFVWRCLTGSPMAPFSHPAHRTGQADPASSSGTKFLAFTHGTSCPSLLRRTSPNRLWVKMRNTHPE
jgi:hypothetical protein